MVVSQQGGLSVYLGEFKRICCLHLYYFMMQLFERLLELPLEWSNGRASGEVVLSTYCNCLISFPWKQMLTYRHIPGCSIM